jgi:predicted membrane chloride channel (bestrophin family)
MAAASTDAATSPGIGDAVPELRTESTPLLKDSPTRASQSGTPRLVAKQPSHSRKSLKEWGKDRLKGMQRNLATSWSCYNMSAPHCTLETDEEGETHLAAYDVQKLTTMRVLLVWTGTVFESPLLWIEMAVIAVIFFSTFSILMHYRWHGFKDFVGRDSDVRAFISMFSTLIGLLLSFYTSLNISRWWDMRTKGVEGICQGCSKLTILLSQGVSRDPDVLSGVKRYALASLMFFFLKDLDRKDQLDRLVDRGVLWPDEAEKLNRVEDAMSFPEACWVWLANVVTQCNQAGLVKGPPHYCALMAAVDEGRDGAATLKTYLDTPIPMGYVHLLGLMVKLHNVILAFLMALVSVKHAGNADGPDAVSTGRAMFRCFFMPLLYNAILIINDELTDPFGGDISDFPCALLCRRLKWDAESFVTMGEQENLPTWIQNLDLKKGEKKP